MSEDLMTAVRAGHVASTLHRLSTMEPAESRGFVPRLKALRKELRDEPWSSEARRAYPALHLAGAVCHRGAAGAAAWLTATDMRWHQAPPAALLQALADRDAGWLGELAQRLATRPASAAVPYPLLSGLVRLSGCPAPVTETYVQGWVRDVGGRWQLGNTLAERLRTEPEVRRMVAALFETDGVAGVLEWGSTSAVAPRGSAAPAADDSSGKADDSWFGSLALLTSEGVLERDAMLDACTARLLRGGASAENRVFLRLLTVLAPTPGEEERRVADWAGMAATAPPTVAAYAQGVLGRLALAGRLTPARFAEVCADVVFRSESRLVRAQLLLLGKVLVTSPDAADAVLPAVADAFGHEDTQIQERALKLAARHLRSASAGTRDTVAGAAERLSPVLRARATDLLGVAPAAVPEPHRDVLPAVPVRRRLAAAPASAAEVAEEVAALLRAENRQGGQTSEHVATLERTLDGLVREAYRDLPGLCAALAPVVAQCWWMRTELAHVDPDRAFARDTRGINVVLAALTERVQPSTLRRGLKHRPDPHPCAHGPLWAPLDARLWEIAHRIRADTPPLLLATPDWESGALDAGTLVGRLTYYRKVGVRPGAADFAQALLRVDRATATPDTVAGARALNTGEGDALVDWLSGPGPALPPARSVRHREATVLELPALPALTAGLPAAFAGLGEPVVYPGAAGEPCAHGTPQDGAGPLATLPGRRELVATRLLSLTASCTSYDIRGLASYLPALAEADGAAGQAVHLSVAYGLGAPRHEERLSAVDALLVLAAREHLDTQLLGDALGELIDSGVVKPQRLAAALSAAAEGGAPGLVWEVLRAALPRPLARFARQGAVGARGVGDLLAVAADCAERTRAHGGIAHLAECAARPGASRPVAQARRLHTALSLAQVS